MPLRFQNRPGLVAYLTIGDPDLATSYNIAVAAIDAGADVLELGVPFSDPVADGPVIQRASERALANGVTLRDVVALAAALRLARPAAGLIIFSYYNPILRLGLEDFCAAAAQAGVDGVLVTDLIVEEASAYLTAMHRHRLAPVFLAAPTSPDARLERIAAACQTAGGAPQGFVYAISRTGITGTRAQLASDAEQLVRRLRKFTQLPIAVGFGISNPEHFAAVGEFADAAVIGSALVATIEQAGPKNAPSSIARFIQGLRGAPALAR
jgi:tryptophan synthase alpha chain